MNEMLAGQAFSSRHGYNGFPIPDSGFRIKKCVIRDGRQNIIDLAMLFNLKFIDC
jgi:hypothetical protein